MNSLLSINESMNIFSLSVHSGARPLYGDLVKLGERFPNLIDDINEYPLSTIATERDEISEYNVFKQAIAGISSQKVENQGMKLGQ